MLLQLAAPGSRIAAVSPWPGIRVLSLRYSSLLMYRGIWLAHYTIIPLSINAIPRLLFPLLAERA